jgi:putative spermidine/putrescine transport system substrate-binding protein
MEFLYSDEGQNLWLKGSCQPVRFDAMTAANAVPVEVLAKTPDTAGTVFPSLAQLDAATRVITTSWDTVVKVDIK